MGGCPLMTFCATKSKQVMPQWPPKDQARQVSLHCHDFCDLVAQTVIRGQNVFTHILNFDIFGMIYLYFVNDQIDEFN